MRLFNSTSPRALFAPEGGASGTLAGALYGDQTEEGPGAGAGDTVAATDSVAPADTGSVSGSVTTDGSVTTEGTVAADGLLTKDPDAKDGDSKDPKDPAPTVAEAFTVESYKDLALPEGITVDAPMFDKFKGLAAELNVSPENATKLLDFHKDFLVSQQDIMSKAITAQDQAWAKELAAIPEFQGENRKAAQEVVGRFIAEFGSPEVRNLLTSYGLQNNPALARLFYSAASALVEGDADPSGAPAPVSRNGKPIKGQSLAQALYSETDPEGLGQAQA
jgi:hypothetical protein